mmetsp:Transcript_20918/g.59668  ORF Transcript_20918/g.59668 Transcript_20918/m.59668 type:complete len:216 (-) Transcript_20918:713-1360(-)
MRRSVSSNPLLLVVLAVRRSKSMDPNWAITSPFAMRRANSASLSSCSDRDGVNDMLEVVVVVVVASAGVAPVGAEWSTLPSASAKRRASSSSFSCCSRRRAMTESVSLAESLPAVSSVGDRVTSMLGRPRPEESTATASTSAGGAVALATCVFRFWLARNSCRYCSWSSSASRSLSGSGWGMLLLLPPPRFLPLLLFLLPLFFLDGAMVGYATIL